MHPELAYFLKINVGLALFYAFYRLFFYKDTFFTWRRTALLCFFVTSIAYPLFNLQSWIGEHEPMLAMADLYASIALPDFTVHAQESHDWQTTLIRTFSYLYGIGIGILILRFLIQLGSLIRLRWSCTPEFIQGKRIYRLPKEANPFSFFHWIFIYPPLHTDEELNEILTHELTHAQQYHSVDVLFSEFVCMACWFNPFAWLLNREVRNNLEYLADHRVIESGHNYQSYQFHLLGLAHHKAAANLSNSFNVLPLKNRIRMMNKKRTKRIGRSKYILFLPLAALLMLVSNIESVARSTRNLAREMIHGMEQGVSEASATDTKTVQTPQKEKKEPKRTVADVEILSAQNPDKDPIFEVTEQLPEYPGGIQELMKFISTNLKYPTQAHLEGREGRVIAQFVVEKDGTISNLRIIKSVYPDLDEEALRILATMPKWTPGKQKGQSVRVKYTVPIAYQLNTKNKTKLAVNESTAPQVTAVDYAETNGTTATTTVFEVVEEMPQFIGGMSGLMKYLAENIQYPTEAQQSQAEGRVVVSMIVDHTGNVTSPKIVSSVSPALDAEAIRVVTHMPQWAPGKQKGIAVNVRYTLPIVFRLKADKAE